MHEETGDWPFRRDRQIPREGPEEVEKDSAHGAVTARRVQNDAGQVYLPPRMAEAAARHSLRLGYSLDQLATDKDRNRWTVRIPKSTRQR